MSVDSKEPSSEEVKIEDESNASENSGVKTASENKSKGKKISIKNLSPAEIIKTFEDAQRTKISLTYTLEILFVWESE